MWFIKLKLVLFLLLLSVIKVNSQNSLNASGSTTTNTSGSVSYSVGQLVYKSIEGDDSMVSQGVQHAYEVYTTYTGDLTVNDIDIHAYPNPTKDFVHLSIANFYNTVRYSLLNSEPSIRYVLTDVSGKLLESKKLTTENTSITMLNLTPAIYFIHIYTKGDRIKTFKIIKN